MRPEVVLTYGPQWRSVSDFELEAEYQKLRERVQNGVIFTGTSSYTYLIFLRLKHVEGEIKLSIQWLDPEGNTVSAELDEAGRMEHMMDFPEIHLDILLKLVDHG